MCYKNAHRTVIEEGHQEGFHRYTVHTGIPFIPVHRSYRYTVYTPVSIVFKYTIGHLLYSALCDGNTEDYELWLGTFVHEMFHVLGLAHMQKRWDRDNYIRVFKTNINNPSQYEICSSCPAFGPYECNSIMHYHQVHMITNNNTAST